MNLLEHLNEVNSIPVLDGHNEAFRTYGRFLKYSESEEAMQWLKENTSIPESGNVYKASIPELEKLPLLGKVKVSVYGGMELEAGYCNGVNSTWNGFEYHKSPEINVFCDDCMLVLSTVSRIRKGGYIQKEDAQVFLFHEGEAIEMYGTTLHLSPLRVKDAGFRTLVILPKGTNTPLSEEERKQIDHDDPETKLLLQRQKWVIASPARKPLIDQGAWPGFVGDNLEMKY
jgi:hypothetical protein